MVPRPTPQREGPGDQEFSAGAGFCVGSLDVNPTEGVSYTIAGPRMYTNVCELPGSGGSDPHVGVYVEGV